MDEGPSSIYKSNELVYVYIGLGFSRPYIGKLGKTISELLDCLSLKF